MPRVARVAADASEAASIKTNNRVYDLQRAGETILILSYGEAYFDVPLQPFDDLPYPAVNHYSHSRGLWELRERLARYYGERFGVGVDPETELVVTAGSKAALYFAMLAVLEPGDEVVMHEPLWVSYPEHARFCRAVPVQLPYTATLGDYERALTERTRMLVLNNPHNPRGYVYTRRELRWLADLAERADVYLLSDEAYADFALDQGFVSAGVLDPDKSHTIVCNSLSKTFSLSGWRIGYSITNAELTAAMLKLNQHLVTCAPTILEHYVAAHFDELLAAADPQMREVVAKRAEVADYLDEIGLEHLPGSSTFYFFVSIEPSRLTSEEFATRLLLEEHVSVVPGLGYGRSCDHFVRVSVGVEPLETIREGPDRVKRLVQLTSAPAARRELAPAQ